MRNALYFTLTLVISVCIKPTAAQDSAIIRNLYTRSLTNPVAYRNLEPLCKQVGGRIGGTVKAEEAVQYIKRLMEGMKLDSVYLQPVMVKHWERGDTEIAQIISKKRGTKDLNVSALGTSIGTGDKGIKAEVIEVHDFLELQSIGRSNIEGKIVFFNRAADASRINPFESYGGAVDQRSRGPVQAARYGAIAVIVRSPVPNHSDFPHTGVTHYADTVKAIPAMCVSTNDADLMATWLKEDPSLKLNMIMNCRNLPETMSANVVGEIRGSDHPDEVIVFGGHLDCWDNSEGAHDDGAGVVQSIEILRLYNELGIKPKHTIRAVAFMDEEIAQRGGKAYAEFARQQGEKQIAAIEADRGSDTPWGFSMDASDEAMARVRSWMPLFKPYNIWFFEKGGSGVDIRELKSQGASLFGLVTDPQRYFDYHHCANDTYDKINPRELQLGAAAMATLVYLIDVKGL